MSSVFIFIEIGVPHNFDRDTIEEHIWHGVSTYISDSDNNEHIISAYATLNDGHICPVNMTSSFILSPLYLEDNILHQSKNVLGVINKRINNSFYESASIYNSNILIKYYRHFRNPTHPDFKISEYDMSQSSCLIVSATNLKGR